MDIYQIIESIKNTGSIGQELMLDSLVVGVEIGRQQLQNQMGVDKIVEQLKFLNKLIADGKISDFAKDDIYSVFLQKKPTSIVQLIDSAIEEGYGQFQSSYSIIRKIAQQEQQQGFQPKQQEIQQLELKKTISEKIELGKQKSIDLNNSSQQIYQEAKQDSKQQDNNYKTPQSLKSSQKITVTFGCPKISCRNVTLLDPNTTSYQCQECQSKYCLLCAQQSHPTRDCNKQVNTVNIYTSKYKECPICENWIEIVQQGTIKCSCSFEFCLDCNRTQQNCACIPPAVSKARRFFGKIKSNIPFIKKSN